MEDGGSRVASPVASAPGWVNWSKCVRFQGLGNQNYSNSEPNIACFRRSPSCCTSFQRPLCRLRFDARRDTLTTHACADPPQDRPIAVSPVFRIAEVMTKLRDYTGALTALRNLGYRLQQSLHPIRDAFKFYDPNGNDRGMKIQKSGVESGRNGRHRYGIAYSALKKLDDMVFFASDERMILIVPTTVLSGIFQSKRHQAVITPSNQWVVNIYFDRYGQQELVPVNFDADYSLSEYAHSI